jgi:hypothetical protein
VVNQARSPCNWRTQRSMTRNDGARTEVRDYEASGSAHRRLTDPRFKDLATFRMGAGYRRYAPRAKPRNGPGGLIIRRTQQAKRSKAGEAQQADRRG